MANWSDVPNECDCGSKEFEYTVKKEVRISVDEDEPYISSVFEGFTDIKCVMCSRIHIKEAEELPGATVGKIHGWYTFEEIQGKFPHFGLRRDDES